MADSGTRYEDEETTTGTMDGYHAYVASTRPTRRVEKVAPSEELIHAGGRGENRTFVSASDYLPEDDADEDGSEDAGYLPEIDDGIYVTLKERVEIVEPRLHRRGIAIAKATFSPAGMDRVGAVSADDRRLLREVWCLNRGKVPLHPATFKPVNRTSFLREDKTSITDLMLMSRAFTALQGYPDRCLHYAPPGASQIMLWRSISRLARTYWTQYAIHAAMQRDRKIWGFHPDTPEKRVVYECGILVDFLLLNFPKERKVYLWPAPPDQPASLRPIP